MKHKRVFVLILCVLFLASGCMRDDTVTQIERGFSDELAGMLKERYELTIPESAVFVGGYFYSGFRDSYVYVAFDLNPEELGVDTSRSDLFPDEPGADISYNPDDKFDAILLETVSKMADVGETYGRYGGDSLNREKMSGEFDREFINGFYYKKKDFTTLYYSDYKNGVISFCFVGWRTGDPIK